MKINRLQIKGFSSHKYTEIEFKEPVALVVGSLGAGKSSINQSVEVGLIGQCEFYRKKTDVAADLVHDLGGVEGYAIAIETNVGVVKRGKSESANFMSWSVNANPDGGKIGSPQE